MKTSLLPLLIAGAASALAAFGPNQRAANASSCGQACTANPACAAGTCTVATATSPIFLNDAARNALLFQIDEERMARELYEAFGKKHALSVFTNISSSEARHEAMFLAIAKRAGVTPPASTPGIFTSKEVQSRYDALLKLGLETPEAALRASAFVEEQDIVDLRDLAKATDQADLRLAATNQERASGHHLAAFVRNLQARGGTYQAQALSADEVSALIQAGSGRGRGGNGQGWRGGNGQGAGASTCTGQGPGSATGGAGQGWRGGRS